jgi:hypothetical protein
MESAETNPLVNQAREVVEGRIGRKVSCPCCGGVEWKTLTDLGDVWGMPASFEPDAHVSGEEMTGPSLFRALVFVCARCSFMRWHYVVPE